MNSNSILDYIPHRTPFVMVDEILYCDLEQCRTQFSIKADNLLVNRNRLSEGGVMEHVAQSCAARIGYISLHIKHEPIRVGVIGAIKNFRMIRYPMVGEVLETEVKAIAEFMDMTVLEAKVFSNDVLVAEGEMKVALIN